MTDQKKFMAFCFSRVTKQPRDDSELRALTWLNQQHKIIQRWAAANSFELAHTEWGTTTHAGTAFSDSVKFREAVRLASARAYPLVMADISELLSRTPVEKIVGCVKALDSLSIDIWDVSRNGLWTSLSLETKKNMINRAAAIRVSRAKPIRVGLRSAATRKKPSANNWERGNLANQTKADAFARQLADFVRSHTAKLVPGSKVSPSALARALNEVGVLSPRSGLWNHNSARNLLERLEKLDRS